MCKIDSWWEPAIQHKLSLVLCDGGSRGRICKYSYKLIQFAAEQKLTQYYKATIHQLGKKKESVERPAAIKWAILERRKDEKDKENSGYIIIVWKIEGQMLFFSFSFENLLFCVNNQYLLKYVRTTITS